MNKRLPGKLLKTRSESLLGKLLKTRNKRLLEKLLKSRNEADWKANVNSII